jgi:hypothetical protein
MRAPFALSLVLLAACAAPPTEERERFVDLSCDGEDVAEAMAAIARVAHREIVVENGVQDPIVVELHRTSWRTAIYEVARAGRCDVDELPNGSFVVSRPEAVPVHLADVPLDRVLRFAAAEAGKGIVVAADVKGLVSVDTYDLGTRGDAERVVRWLLARHHLSATAAGDVRVISREALPLDVSEGDKGEPAQFMAWKAPAAGWFALLERLMGRKVSHGRAPLTIHRLRALPDDVLRATALASRVHQPRRPLQDLRPLTKLPSGEWITATLQATVTRVEQPLALVDGRVVAEGDELLPGVVVRSINEESLTLSQGEQGCELDPP